MNYRNRAGLRSMLDLAIAIAGAYGMYSLYQVYGAGMFRFYALDAGFFLVVVAFVCADYTFQIMRAKMREFPKFLNLFKYFAVCTVTVSLVGSLCALAPLRAAAEGIGYGEAVKAAALQGPTLWLNVIVPVLGIVSLLLGCDYIGTRKSAAVWAVSPVLVYALILMSLNGKGTVTGPYPFLETAAQPWYLTLAWLIGFLAVAYGISLGLFLAWRGIWLKRNPAPVHKKKKK